MDLTLHTLIDTLFLYSAQAALVSCGVLGFCFLLPGDLFWIFFGFFLGPLVI